MAIIHVRDEALADWVAQGLDKKMPLCVRLLLKESMNNHTADNLLWQLGEKVAEHYGEDFRDAVEKLGTALK